MIYIIYNIHSFFYQIDLTRLYHELVKDIKIHKTLKK